MRVMAEHVAISGADTSVAQTLLLDRAKNEKMKHVQRERENARNESDISQMSVAKGYEPHPLQKVMSHGGLSSSSSIIIIIINHHHHHPFL